MAPRVVPHFSHDHQSKLQYCLRTYEVQTALERGAEEYKNLVRQVD